MRIYTRTGDRGETGLIGGSRVAKNSLRIAAIGDVDELNAALGTALAHDAPAELHRVQCWLFDLGAELASPKEAEAAVGERHVAWLEGEIDRHMGALPPLRAFILPGGSPASAALHAARAVCRRAERSILALHEAEAVAENARAFVNRLSDYLFAAARAANAAAGVTDVEWHHQEEP